MDDRRCAHLLEISISSALEASGILVKKILPYHSEHIVQPSEEDLYEIGQAASNDSSQGHQSSAKQAFESNFGYGEIRLRFVIGKR